MERYIASVSGGKDSLASVITALENDEPLDEAIYCEVMFDTDISGEIPEHRDFIFNKMIPRLNSWGIKTSVLRHPVNTYVSNFTSVITRGALKGMIRGFPMCGKCTINRDCKVPPLKKYRQDLNNRYSKVTQYIGMASDEQDRLLRLAGKNSISLLDKYKIDGQKASEICKKNDLYSPAYEFTKRTGCWFCMNAKPKELRHLYDYHPDLWERMLELQRLPNKAIEHFNRKDRFSEIDFEFKMDDAQETLFKQFPGIMTV